MICKQELNVRQKVENYTPTLNGGRRTNDLRRITMLVLDFEQNAKLKRKRRKS